MDRACLNYEVSLLGALNLAIAYFILALQFIPKKLLYMIK